MIHQVYHAAIKKICTSVSVTLMLGQQVKATLRPSPANESDVLVGFTTGTGSVANFLPPDHVQCRVLQSTVLGRASLPVSHALTGIWALPPVAAAPGLSHGERPCCQTVAVASARPGQGLGLRVSATTLSVMGSKNIKTVQTLFQSPQPSTTGRAGLDSVVTVTQ